MAVGLDRRLHEERWSVVTLVLLGPEHCSSCLEVCGGLQPVGVAVDKSDTGRTGDSTQSEF
jgi:hypothetical protein